MKSQFIFRTWFTNRWADLAWDFSIPVCCQDWLMNNWADLKRSLSNSVCSQDLTYQQVSFQFQQMWCCWKITGAWGRFEFSRIRTDAPLSHHPRFPGNFKFNQNLPQTLWCRMTRMCTFTWTRSASLVFMVCNFLSLVKKKLSIVKCCS